MKEVDIPDINVWIALTIPSHEHHHRAQLYWNNEAKPQLSFCSITMIGLVRVCSNAPIAKGTTLSKEDAWSIYVDWAKQPEVSYLRENENTRTEFIRIVSDGLTTRHTWTDGYLAALAKSTGSRLVSFDGDFKVFDGLEFLHLK